MAQDENTPTDEAVIAPPGNAAELADHAEARPGADDHFVSSEVQDRATESGVRTPRTA